MNYFPPFLFLKDIHVFHVLFHICREDISSSWRICNFVSLLNIIKINLAIKITYRGQSYVLQRLTSIPADSGTRGNV